MYCTPYPRQFTVHPCNPATELQDCTTLVSPSLVKLAASPLGVLLCAVLYGIVLFCTILYCALLWCIEIQCTALQC